MIRRLLAILATVAALGLPVAIATASPAQAQQEQPSYDRFGPQGTIYRLYRAYFLREPDRGGFDYWYGVYKQGYPLDAISNDFARSEEFQQRYGDIGDREFVQRVYNNVLQRDPDQGGYDYWVKQMEQGMLRGFVMIYFSDSEEFRNKTKNGVPPGYRQCGSAGIYQTADWSCLADLEAGDGDVNCSDVPRSARPVRLYDPANDPYNLDGDGDGTTCEVA